MRRRFGINKVPEPIDYSTKYLTFKSRGTGTFTLTIGASVTTTDLTSVSYSLNNGNTWTTINNSSSAVTITTPTINAGDKVLWKGIGSRMTNGTGNANRSIFSSTVDFDVEGNIMSLLFGDNFVNQLILNSTYTFAYLFYNNKKIINTNNLVLPATQIGEYCYYYMFASCSYLQKTTKVLPADNIPRRCYAYMFQSCGSLVEGPYEISATVHTGTAVCHSMFQRCNYLAKAPILHTTILKGYDYMRMFSGCSSLNYIKMMATDISKTQCLDSWVSNVSSTGTFVKNVNATWTTTGASGIPTGWTVETATE